MSSPDGGAMGAGGADAPDLEVGGGGDATGGGSMGDPDAMGSDEELTVDEGSGLPPGEVSPGTTAGRNPAPGGGSSDSGER
jgi:hypothetical protein